MHWTEISFFETMPIVFELIAPISDFLYDESKMKTAWTFKQKFINLALHFTCTPTILVFRFRQQRTTSLDDSKENQQLSKHDGSNILSFSFILRCNCDSVFFPDISLAK